MIMDQFIWIIWLKEKVNTGGGGRREEGGGRKEEGGRRREEGGRRREEGGRRRKEGEGIKILSKQETMI